MTKTQNHDARPIDDRLAEYRALLAQFETMRNRVRRTEEERQSVPRRVYEKVRAEYDRELDALRARMSPLRDDLDRTRDEYEGQLKEANEALEAMEEEMAELVFRHRVGEFTDEVMNERRAEIDERIGTVRARIAAIRETLAELDHGRSALDTENAAANPETFADAPLPPVSPPPRETSAPRPPAAEPVAEKRPVLRPARPAVPADNAFENPHDWVDEFGGEAKQRGTSKAATPDPEADPQQEAPPPAETAAPPSLVFVSGPHAGQSIPLLLTTLTIGREHDNNIEIKDLDVARYHARILNLRGEYMIEDMASSTGTWVNGVRVERTALGHGDVIRIGQTEIAVDFEWASNSLERAGIDPAA